jgi:hypothetical protein
MAALGTLTASRIQPLSKLCPPTLDTDDVHPVSLVNVSVKMTGPKPDIKSGVDVAEGKGDEVRVGIKVGNSMVAVAVAGSGVDEGGMTVSIERQALNPRNAPAVTQRNNEFSTRLLCAAFITS